MDAHKFSMHKYHLLLSVFLVVAATAALGTNIMGIDGPLRITSGFVLSCLAPGYLLLMLLVPDELEWAERVAISVVASFMLSMFAGIGLDLAGQALESPRLGLNTVGVTWALWSVTILLFLATCTRMRTAYTTATDDTLQHKAPRLKVGISLRPYFGRGPVALLLALAFLGGSAGIAADSLLAAARPQPKHYTALSIEGTRISVENHEGAATSYRLELREGTDMLQAWSVPSISDEQTWTGEITDAENVSSEIILYKDNGTTPYRRVRTGGK